MRSRSKSYRRRPPTTGPDTEKHQISFGDFIAEPAKQRLSCQILRYSRTAQGHTQADGLHLVASDEFAMQQRIHGNVFSNSFTNDVTDRITKRIAKSEYSTVQSRWNASSRCTVTLALHLNLKAMIPTMHVQVPQMHNRQQHVACSFVPFWRCQKLHISCRNKLTNKKPQHVVMATSSSATRYPGALRCHAALPSLIARSCD